MNQPFIFPGFFPKASPNLSKSKNGPQPLHPAHPPFEPSTWPMMSSNGLPKKNTQKTNKPTSWQRLYMDVFKNSGFSPLIIHFNMVFQYKSSILGYPYFWKHPYKYLESFRLLGFVLKCFKDICKLLVFFFKKKAEIPVFLLSSRHSPMDRSPIEALRHLSLGDDISQPRSSFSEVS